MLKIFTAYKKYPYKIPARVRFFNLFRYWFKIPFLEQLIVSQILKGNNWWKKAIPPIYFYSENTIRKAKRDNINYVLDISCLIDHSIYFCTLKEPSLANLFKVIKPHFIVLDVGANIGFVTLNLARSCYNGFVYSFEPDSRNFHCLQVNLKENNFQNIASFQIAAGMTSEKMVLTKREKTNPGANRILPAGADHQYDQEWVDVKPLDLIADQLKIPRIDLIKIDVEGFELFALKGGESLIRKHKPILFVELAEANLRQQSLNSTVLIDYIESLDYDVIDARTMQQIDKLKADHHTDVLCFPK